MSERSKAKALDDLDDSSEDSYEVVAEYVNGARLLVPTGPRKPAPPSARRQRLLSQVCDICQGPIANSRHSCN
jgi:hypothetical protein